VVGIGESGEINPGFLGSGGQDSIMAIIRDYFGPNILLGQSPFNLETIIAMMDKMVRGNNQAKATIDMALHDLLDKSLGVPLYQLLGGVASERIPLGWVLTGKSLEENLKMATRAIEAGFLVLNL
jgi:L-alanine-DL-glutamate epimerase-like enolase superfamily enzyme